MVSLLVNLQSKHLDFRELDKSTDQQPLMIIGVGLGRTGTMSLRKALQILTDKPCYHMFEILSRHRDHVPRWIEIFKQCQENSVDDIDPALLREIFKGYAMADGHPACAVYEKLMELYPNAKVILSLRDSRKWLESFRETIGAAMIKTENGRWNQLIENLTVGSQFREMAALSMKCALGWDLNFLDDEALIRAYETRNQDIQNRVPPERLLCFNVKEGWEPLCKFLNLPIPDEPFPHVNDRQEMQTRLRRLERLKFCLSWAVPTLLAVGIGLAISYVIKL